MREFFDRTGRTFATGVCFAVFGLGELALAFVIFPLLMLCMRDKNKRGRIAKYVIHKSFRIFVELMRVTGTLDYETRHLERLDRPGLLVLANHPTLIDVVFLISFIRQADCIVKDALLKNPFTRYAILAGGFIRNAAGGEALVERCGTTMAEGNVLIIFPEGTRSEPDRMRELQRGAAHIALRNKRNITPVMIRVREHNLGRNSRWWKVPKKRMRMEFEVGEDILVIPFIERQREAPAAARELTTYLTRYFAERVGAYGTA
jgi:1-acyl-sn-glycerol-3-phosphate acyltransferase